MNELLKSERTYETMSLEQRKELRDAFERDLTRGGDSDYVVARLTILNALIITRCLELKEEKK